MSERKKYRFIFYLAFIIFFGYAIADYIPGVRTEGNNIYFKIWLIVPLLLLTLYAFLNRKKKEKDDPE